MDCSFRLLPHWLVCHVSNLFRECGVVERLSKTAARTNHIVTILLGLGVGSKLAAEKFLRPETSGIIALGLVAFAIGTASGLILARIMNVSKRENQSAYRLRRCFCCANGRSSIEQG